MAQTIDVHPVRFNNEQHCSIEQGFNQIVQCGDITQFQLLLEPCASDHDLVLNGSFTDASASPWVVNDPTHWGYNSILGEYWHYWGTGIGTLGQAFDVADGVILEIIFTVEFSDNAGSVALLMGTFAKTYTESGTYTESYVADGVAGIGWLVSDDNIRFKYASVRPVNTNYSFRVVDRDGVTVQELNTTSDPSYFTFVYPYGTFSFDWNDKLGECLPDGCYHIEVAEPCDCGNGGFVAEDFTTSQGQWTGDLAAWNFNLGLATFNGLGSPATVTISDVVCAGEDYEVSFELFSMTGTDSFQVRLGAQLGTLRTTDGVHTETITATGSSLTTFQMIGDYGGTPSSFSVGSLTVRRVPKNYGLRSNPFELASQAPCSVLITACNDEDGLQGGFDGTGFSARLRMKCTYGQGYYGSEQEQFENSYGTHNRYYYRGHKIKSLRYGCAEYLHDFLAHLGGYDHVFIDGVEVFVYDEEYPKPEYVMNYDYGTVEIGVGNKTELIEKRKCSGVVSTCEPDGQGVILGVDGDGGILSGEGYEIITSG